MAFSHLTHCAQWVGQGGVMHKENYNKQSFFLYNSSEKQCKLSDGPLAFHVLPCFLASSSLSSSLPRFYRTNKKDFRRRRLAFLFIITRSHSGWQQQSVGWGEGTGVRVLFIYQTCHIAELPNLTLPQFVCFFFSLFYCRSGVVHGATFSKWIMAIRGCLGEKGISMGRREQS